jgi:hypothetical protein
MMEWFFSKIKSLTTDMGGEFKLIDAPNVLYAYMRRIQGVPMASLMGTIDLTSRLFSRALRIAGWGHLFGNLMKASTRSVPDWPRILDLTRSLCRFFRNPTWRKHLVRKLGPVYPGIALLLKKFKGKLAKWRYETLAQVFESLLKLRLLCETHLINVVEIMGKTQMKETIADVQTACRWSEFWVFIACFYGNILQPLEGARRWGLVCACCREWRRMLPRKARCPRASRRGAEIRNFITVLVGSFTTLRQTLTLEQCEGVPWVYSCISLQSSRTATDLWVKLGFVKLVPWLISEANDPVVALDCCNQLKNADESRLTLLELDYKRNLLPHLEACYQQRFG